jgi:acylphosphatase
MRKRLSCTLTGIVQGVMFRDFVKRKAVALGLVGTVRNMSDGSVSVIAEGEEKDLEKLIPLLRKGPIISRMVARVDHIEERWGDATGEFSNFQILY